MVLAIGSYIEPQSITLFQHNTDKQKNTYITTNMEKLSIICHTHDTFHNAQVALVPP